MKKMISLIIAMMMTLGFLSPIESVNMWGVIKAEAYMLSTPAKVIFDPNGGSGGPGTMTWYDSAMHTTDTVMIDKTTMKAMGIPRKFPYTFIGWTTSPTSSYPSFGLYSSSLGLSDGETRKLYAGWEECYETGGLSASYNSVSYYPCAEEFVKFVPDETGLYSFNIDGMPGNTDNVWEFGRLYDANDNLLKETYNEYVEDCTFTYYLEKNKTYYVSAAMYGITEYSEWWLSIARQYIITYDANGGYGGIETQAKLYETPMTITDVVPESDVRPFLGWSTNKSATEPEYVPGDEYNQDGDATLYAVWGNASGNCGDNLKWELFEGRGEWGRGTLLISGSGKMDDYSLENRPPWYDLRDKITAVRIDGTAQNVTIGKYAFSDCVNLLSVNLSQKVDALGEYAFSGCTSLETAHLEYASFKDIPAYAFYNCNNLSSFSPPLNYENIGEYAFYGCSSLYNIPLSESLKTVGHYAFANCESLWYFRCDGEYTVIEPYTFYNCNGLKSVEFYSDVEKISDSAFAGCSSLAEITIPDTVTVIEKAAFGNCSNLKTITIPDSVAEMGMSIFAFVKDNVTIKCYLDTVAHHYALDNGIKYEIIPWGKLDSPVFEKTPIMGGASVTISASGGTVYYTTDGSTPTVESKKYTSPIPFRKNATIKAIAVKEGWTDSEVAEFYTDIERVATPFANIESGLRVPAGTKIELYTQTQGAQILYTTDQTVPSEDDVYEGAFEIKENTIVYAYATCYGMLNSLLANFSYDISVAEDTPEVTTLDATDITDSSARVFAQIDDKNGVLYNVQFVYHEKNNSGAKYVVEADEDNSAVLTGLTPNTEYWYQARAINELGWSYGFMKSFKTDAQGVIKPTSVELTPGYISCKVGQKRTILAKVLPVDVDNNSVYWSSEDETVATVDQNGVVTAVGLGNTKIKATTVSNRITATCRIDVVSTKIVGDFNFSEHNMITNSSNYDEHGFDHGVNDGGNALMASAYLARWDGAVLEENDAYPDGLENVKYKEVQADYHVQDILYIPYRNGDLDNDEIKNAIMKYGAVYTSFKVGYEYNSQNMMQYKYFDETQTNYYFPKNAPAIHMGHAIVIVGWDDNYSRANFDVIPPGNGAFICKNSWGLESGDGGYFYVSYYDKYIARSNCGDYNAVFLSAESNDNYNKIYQYDYLGPVGAQDFGMPTLYSANVFPEEGKTLTQNELLSAVSFYSYAPGETYEIYVVSDYKDINSLSKLGSPVKTGVSDYAGYHTIKLDEGIQLSAGSRFAVVVKQTAMNGTTKIFVEMPTKLSGGISHSSNAKANRGESFVGMDSKMWMDLTDYLANANCCIKAFTKTDEAGVMLQAIDNLGREYADDTVHSVSDLKEKDFIFNEDFIEHYESSDEITLFDLASEWTLGATPPSIIPDLTTNRYYSAGAVLPARYDLREENSMTDVKNQGNIGSCWSFATYASLESAIKKLSNNSSSVSSDGLNMVYGAADSISLDSTGAIMALGNTLKLNATLVPYDSDDEIIWSSSNERVVSISTHGYVRALGTGNAYVVAKAADGNVTAQCAITVTKPTEVTDILINNTETTLSAGDILMIDYNVYPQNAGDKEIIWEVSDDDIAEINEYGILKAKAAGKVTVTAFSSDKSIKCDYTLYIEDDFACRMEIAENTLDLAENEIKGKIKANVVNKTTDTVNAEVMLCIYDDSGRLYKVYKTDNTAFASGENAVCFDDISIKGELFGKYRIKLVLWDSIAGQKPLSAAKTR